MVTIVEVLRTWEQAGVFAYLLPFLMIFAVVFGILNKSKLLGTNKGVQATIALTVGLLSLVNDYVPNFFSALFPYAGMAIAVLLVALILMGLAFEEDWSGKIWFAIGIISFFVVIISAFSDMPFGIGVALQDSWPALLAGGLLIWLMYLIVFSPPKEKKK
ncbi:hypothetical protein GOV12_03020 [Candidatus Pacearchaeota archaeon]|nr:hypothetical protein [Candidatus Pacearchaeota archaeon]